MCRVERTGSHVVVEDSVLVAVDVKQPLSIVHTEIFEVQQTMGIMLADELDESADRDSEPRFCG